MYAASANSGGSSPRGRGKRGQWELTRLTPGLIPAWAGKTPVPPPPRRQRRAHPRVGGENVPRDPGDPLNNGSSPRGRGKRMVTLPRLPAFRLIPAWAGKTGLSGGCDSCSRAHPRVGGENVLAISSKRSGSGSSPRGRGKRNPDRASPTARRLIPAWAGKTCGRTGARERARAHPRVGGENPTIRPPEDLIGGSSPRGRGKRLLLTSCPGGSGLIPAWAGKTMPLGALRRW